IIEGTNASVPPQGGRKHPHQEMLEIDTSKILFICGGAFIGLDKLIEARVAERNMGFGSTAATISETERMNLLNKVIPDDLVKFGLIPELIGRLPVSAALQELTKNDLKRILTEPKNAITRQFQTSFRIDDVDLQFTGDAIEAIADIAIKHKTGARGLRAIVEKMLLDIMFEMPSLKGHRSLVITGGIIAKSPQLDIALLTERKSA
uniref:AAA family ATPase n=1 Tax=Treponema endosymbiont of Eucomonympha sp. TaxID=1580831 RepID=UPI000B314C04